MTSNVIEFLAPKAAALAAVVLTGSLWAPLTQAQQVYRIVGPDGKITFSDQPPPPSSNAKVSSATASASKGVATANLPFELRQVANQYPVTLYTGDNCSPCASARTMLSNRGIPFAERTVNTPEDAQALQRMSGDTSLPFATIGSQQLKGFSDAEWTQFLDAAGYPKTSVLPASYRQAPATPLVTVSTAPAANGSNPAQTSSPARPARPAPAPPPSAENPAGIRF